MTGIGFGLGDEEGAGVWATVPTTVPVNKKRERKREQGTEIFIKGGTEKKESREKI
jgi:hypothetical protein